GLMFRQSNDAGSPMVGVYVRPDANAAGKGEIVFTHRQANDTPLQQRVVGKVDSLQDVWLRLQRREQWLFAVYTANDGVRWSQLLGATRGYFRLTGQVGVTTAAANASFRDFATIRRQAWYFPSPYDCLSCHNQNAGTILGVNARQLNRDLPDGGNQ